MLCMYELNMFIAICIVKYELQINIILKKKILIYFHFYLLICMREKEYYTHFVNE